MRYLIPLLLALSACATAPKTDLAGQWDGAVEIEQLGQTLRLELHFTESTDGYSAYLISVDQGGARVDADSVTLNEGQVSLAFNNINGTYTGTVQDGTLTGTWKQDAFGAHTEAPLNLQKQVVSD